MTKAPADIRSFARQHTTLAINTLASVARGSKNDSARVNASVALLDRGWGRVQPDPDAQDHLNITIRQILEGSVTVVETKREPEPVVIEHNANDEPRSE